MISIKIKQIKKEIFCASIDIIYMQDLLIYIVAVRIEQKKVNSCVSRYLTLRRGRTLGCHETNSCACSFPELAQATFLLVYVKQDSVQINISDEVQGKC